MLSLCEHVSLYSGAPDCTYRAYLSARAHCNIMTCFQFCQEALAVISVFRAS